MSDINSLQIWVATTKRLLGGKKDEEKTKGLIGQINAAPDLSEALEKGWLRKDEAGRYEENVKLVQENAKKSKLSYNALKARAKEILDTLNITVARAELNEKVKQALEVAKESELSQFVDEIALRSLAAECRAGIFKLDEELIDECIFAVGSLISDAQGMKAASDALRAKDAKKWRQASNGEQLKQFVLKFQEYQQLCNDFDANSKNFDLSTPDRISDFEALQVLINTWLESDLMFLLNDGEDSALANIQRKIAILESPVEANTSVQASQRNDNQAQMREWRAFQNDVTTKWAECIAARSPAERARLRGVDMPSDLATHYVATRLASIQFGDRVTINRKPYIKAPSTTSNFGSLKRPLPMPENGYDLNRGAQPIMSFIYHLKGHN